MHAIPPTPLIKVASDAKPYYKLQPTTLNGGEGGVVYFINDMYYWRRIFVRRAAFQSKCLNNFATSCSSSSTVRIRIRSIQNWIKQESVYFLLCPQQGHKIEGVVLHTVCILVFCPKQSQGLKPSAASPGA